MIELNSLNQKHYFSKKRRTNMKKNKEAYDLSKLKLDSITRNGKIEYMVVYENSSSRNKLFEKQYTQQNVYPFHLLVDFANWLEEEYKQPILDDVEKVYLSAVIKPFRKDIKYIVKRKFVRDSEYIVICFQNNESLPFPTFKAASMYNGMKLCKEYSLEDLGL